MRTIDADVVKELFNTKCARECDKCNYYENCKGNQYCGLIDQAPTYDERIQKVIVVPPEIIDPVAKAIVDTIYKLDWDTIIKMYRGGACKGEWITNEQHNTVCSICGGIRRDNRFDHIDFCNKCGADMR